MTLSNKTILIVGASSGIGRAVALKLAINNNRLIISARRQAELESLKLEITKLGSECLIMCCDALSESQSKQAIEKSIDAFGIIDVALLNVGDGPSFNMSKSTVAEIAHMKVNKSGLIAHTNSLAGFIGLPMQGPYSAAKAACRILIDTCRIELKPFGIKFVSAYPGFVATERVADDGIPAPFEISEDIAANYIVRAIEKEKSDYLFPFVTGALIRLARVLPKAILGWVLGKSVPADY